VGRLRGGQATAQVPTERCGRQGGHNGQLRPRIAPVPYGLTNETLGFRNWSSAGRVAAIPPAAVP